MITQASQTQKLQIIDKEHISLYHFSRAKEDITKGNKNITVLYELLLKEINLHNGVITKKYNKVRKTPTID